MADEIENVTAAAPKTKVKTRGYEGLSPMEAALLYGGAASTVMGPLGILIGIGAGVTAGRNKKSYLEREAKYLEELEGSQRGLTDQIRSELDIADPDERRALANAQRIADDGMRKVALGDPTGQRMIDAANQTIEGIINGDIAARKAENSANAGFMRDLIKTAATDYRAQYQANLSEFEKVDQQASRVLSLTAEDGFDPNKPINRAILSELVSSGMGMYRDVPDTWDAVSQGVGSLAGMGGPIGMAAGGLAEAVIAGIKSDDFKLSAEDFNRLALNMQKTARQYAEMKMQRLGNQAMTLDQNARRIGAIPEDYSLADYVSGNVRELLMTPAPKSPQQRLQERAQQPPAPAAGGLGNTFRGWVNQWNQSKYHQPPQRLPTN